MGSYQQRRLEYEVLEYNQGGGGAFGGASGFSAVKGGGYGGGAAGGYGAGGAGAGYGAFSSGGYGACSRGYRAGGGGGFGAVGGGYGAAGGGYGAAGGGYGAAGGGYGAGGGGYGAGGGGYGGGGYGSAVGGGGGSYSSGFGGAIEYSAGGCGGGGFDCGSGGYSQTQTYKNEIQTKATKTGYGVDMGGGGDPFCSLVPSSFPPGTDPKFIDCFNMIDKDRSGQICDKELMVALSSFDQKFSLRTVHLLMYMFTGSYSKELGPKEFIPLVHSLQTWKATFQKYDCDRNGRLDERELKDALMSMGFAVSPFVIKLVMSKYDKSGYKCAIEYDYFIECCVIVKGLTEKFREKEDDRGCGVASFTYDEFLLSVLPFIVA